MSKCRGDPLDSPVLFSIFSTGADYANNIARMSKAKRRASCRARRCAPTIRGWRRFSTWPAFRRDAGFRDDATVYLLQSSRGARAAAAVLHRLGRRAAGDGRRRRRHRQLQPPPFPRRQARNALWRRRHACSFPIRSTASASPMRRRPARSAFAPHRHEGKLTGLAALGEPAFADRMAAAFRRRRRRPRAVRFPRASFAMYDFMQRHLPRSGRREDVAASIQKVLEDTMLASVAPPAGAASGAPSRPCRRRVRQCAPQPAVGRDSSISTRSSSSRPMGDEGLPVGGALAFLLRRDGIGRLARASAGGCTTSISAATIAARHRCCLRRHRRRAAARRQSARDGGASVSAAGEIGAIYTGRMEFGPRALGARSHPRQSGAARDPRPAQ